MKCKSVFLTLVSLLCFVEISVGQTYTVEASCDNPGNITLTTGTTLLQDGDDFYFEFTCSGGWPGFKIYKDGTNVRDLTGYSPDNISIAFFDNSSYYYASWNNWLNWGGWVGRFGIPDNATKGRVTLKSNGDGTWTVLYRMNFDENKTWRLEPTNNSAVSAGDFISCGDKYKFFIQANDQYNEFQFQISQDGDYYTNNNFFTTSNISIHDWNPKKWYFSASSSMKENGCWIILDPKNYSLNYSLTEPNCGNKVKSASVIGTSCLGSTLLASYEVESGSFDPTYQWYKDGSEISGVTNSTYTPSEVGSYTVRVYADAADENTSALSSAFSITGPTVTTATLTSNNSVFCSGNTILSVDDDASCYSTGYPKYEWYNGSNIISDASSNTYSPTVEGTYKVRVYADATTYRESDPITLSAPSPSITITPSELSLNAEVSGDANSDILTVSLDNSCSTLKTPVITGANASMYSVTNKGDGTYSITFTPGTTKGSFPATITFTSDDNAVSELVSLKGKVVSCTSTSVSIPSTTFTLQSGDTYEEKNVNIGAIETTNDYSVCFDITEYTGRTDWGEYTISASVGGKSVYDKKFAHQQSFSPLTGECVVVNGSALSDGLKIKLFKGKNEGNITVSNISIVKACPPEIEYSTISNECDASPSFTAEVTKGSADIKEYNWYVITEGTPTLVATHTSSSLTDTYAPGSEIGTGKTVKVIVTDANGLSADVSYEINCGPVIGDITTPAEICPGGDLTMTVPSYTPTEGIISSGWEVAESATATSSEWNSLTSLNDIPETYKNWYIRYYAQNSVGKGKSNAVQITMYDAPVVDPISIDDICNGDAFDLSAPNVDYDATKVSEGWEYSTQADFTDATSFSGSETFSSGTYYIRYVATDACTTTSYATTSATVNNPSLAVTEYTTYMRVAGTEQAVTDAPILTETCVGTLTYSITSGNEKGYFTIDSETGVVTMTSNATKTGDFPIIVTITDGTTSVAKDLVISLTEEPTLIMECPSKTDYYVYTKYQKLDLQNVITSQFVNEDITLTLSGSAASYFDLSSTSITKNTSNNLVSITQNDYFTSVGDYTLNLTATTDGLTKECDVNIHTKQISFTDYINDQTNCSSDAPSLMVEVTGEDATNLPLTYQWYNDGVEVSGATNNSFKPTEDGNYYCIVSTGGSILYTSKTSSVTFVKNVPTLSFDEVTTPIPSSIYCTEEVGVTMKVTNSDNEDITSDYSRFWWLNGNLSDGLTATGVHTFAFDCANETYNVDLRSYIIDNATGCSISVSKTIEVKKMAGTYYYCGPTGDASNLTDPNNWCTIENTETTSGDCIHPLTGTVEVDVNNDGVNETVNNAFYVEGCQYIINKDDVKLKSDQTWTVLGTGSSIKVSNGYWENGELPSAGSNWSTLTNSYDYKNGQYFEYSSATMNGKNQVERLTSVASYDYREYAKELTIEGTLNTYNSVKVDVNNGGSLNIATTNGNFELGVLAQDECTNVYGNSNGYYNVCMNPGSSVTYTGSGTEKIREGVYSQLYIEPTNSSDKTIFEEGAKIEIVQSMKLGTNATYENIDANKSTILYEGLVNQDIASMPYYILDVENPNNKTLTGKIDVNKSFIIGAGTNVIAGNNIININGEGTDAIVFDGLFECGTSTVNYTSSNETTVVAMDYYNLNLGDGNRTFETNNNVGIAGTFSVSNDEDVTYTVENSTIEFNGTETQVIPKFTFYNLTINNSAMSNNSNETFFDNTYYVKMIGDVTVENKLLLTQGILNVNDSKLLVENTSADAVGQGYLTSYKDASFIVGNVTRTVPSSLNGSDVSTLYYFPVGDEYGYKPLTLSQLTTGENATVTVGISSAVSGNFVDGENTDAFSSSFSWKVEGTNYTSASVGISTSQGLGDANAIAYNTKNSGEFSNVYGSTSGNSILYSQVTEPGYFALAKRTITNKKYYFNCSGSDDASSIEAWFTEENGGGTRAGAFNDPDAEWIFNCGTTINSTLTIDGANSKVTMNIPQGEDLKINSDVSFITGSIKQGTVTITSSGELDIRHSFTMNDVSQGGSGINTYNRSAIVNNGTVNIYNSTLVLTDSWITNNGRFNMTNTDLTMSSNANQSITELLKNLNDNPTEWIKSQAHTCFWNHGSVVMTNGSLDVNDGTATVVHVLNDNNAVWLIDNTNASGVKHVTFDGCELNHNGEDIAYVDMKCGSSFVVKNSDVQLLYKGNTSADIGGQIIVEDGNLYIARSDGASGGKFTLEQSCGTMYLIDKDGSGDGILELKGAGGGYEVNIEGKIYAMGVVESGGNGANLNIKKDGTMFIGDLGATVPAYTWNFSIQVESGGTLYYCGNRTSGADGVGSNEGQLYYAGSYYETRNPMTKDDASNPSGEGDFSGGGKSEAMFVGEVECMKAYNEGLPDTSPSKLLPIEMTMLYGVCSEGTIEIHWQTMSETDNAGFTILRSVDGITFKEVGFVDGMGTTSEMQNYMFEDKVAQKGLVYYKLRQIDFDGTVTETKVIAVQTCGKNAQFVVKKDEVEVLFNYPESSNYVVMTTLTGKILYSKSFKDVESARIALPQSNGVYIISVIDKQQITSEKIVKY